jgi:hypothetical protein
VQNPNDVPGVAQVFQDIERQDRVEWAGFRDNPEHEGFILKVAAVSPIDCSQDLIGNLISDDYVSRSPRLL